MDIGLIWDSRLLLERYLAEHVPSSGRIEPLTLASPFAPKPKVIVIPTGYGEPKYTRLGKHLKPLRTRLASFVKGGGVLVVFGALNSMRLDFLPEPIEYVADYGTRTLTWTGEHLPRIVDEESAECDGYLVAKEDSGWVSLCTDELGRVVAARLEHGRGIVVATSLHELPSPAFLKAIVDVSRV
ncbi:MAG: hypothetical protein ACXQS1_04815 [Methermicoccaceae archaeon]